MNRDEFDHVIRAAAGVTGLHEFVVIGSQAILAVFADAPRALRQSIELDLYPKEFPERSIEIDGSIGELSFFHQTHGIYGHGVAPDTPHFPDRWESRCHTISVLGYTEEIIVHAPDVHDLAFSKLAAGRKKDVAYVREMIRCSMVGTGRLERLIDGEKDTALQNRLRNALADAKRQ